MNIFQDHKVPVTKDHTKFFSAPHSITTGYLARAVVNNVLHGGLLATGSDNDNDTQYDDMCKMS